MDAEKCFTQCAPKAQVQANFPITAGWSFVWATLSETPDLRRLFHELTAILPFGIALVGCEGRILETNAIFRELAGVSRPDLNNLCKGELESFGELSSILRLATRGDGSTYYQHWYGSRVSDERWVILTGEALQFGIAGDVVARLAVEWLSLKLLSVCPPPAVDAVADTDAGLAVLDILCEPIVVVDATGRTLAANKAWGALSQELRKFSGTGEAAASKAYFALLEPVLRDAGQNPEELLQGVQCTIDGSLQGYQQSLSVGKEGDCRHFQLRVAPWRGGGSRVAVISHHDITVRHKTEQALMETDALFRRVIEDTADGIFMYDTQGRFVMTNPANAEVLGYTVNQIKGSSIDDVFAPPVAQIIREHNQLVLSTGRSLDFELPIAGPRGNRTVHVRKGVFRNQRDEVVGIFGIARDITDRKRAEQALEKSERHFRALIENSADCIALMGENCVIRYASPSSKRLFGFEVSELEGSDAFQWIHSDDHREAKRAFKELMELPGASVISQYRVLCKGGCWRWTEATSTNLLHDPSVRAIVVNQRDISERKHAETELMRFEAIVKSSNDAIIGADLEGKITSWNPAAERIFGYTESDILGKNISILVPRARKGECEGLIAAVSRGRGTDDFETVRIGRKRRRVDVSLTLSPIRDRDRRVIGFSKIVRDITDRRRMEHEILEISDHEKQRLGHDLHDDVCQLLVGISLLGSVLHDDLHSLGIKQADDARQLTELARAAVERARNLAHGLSSLQFLDSGFAAALELLVTDTERLFRIPCAFECNAPIEMEDASVANHLYRITQEALHNAVKHSKASKVAVILQTVDDAFVLVVRDDGVGISESRGAASAGKSSRSGGLGTHIMQYRAKIIGATLEFKRNPDRGTSVICRMPGKLDRVGTEPDRPKKRPLA